MLLQTRVTIQVVSWIVLTSKPSQLIWFAHVNDEFDLQDTEKEEDTYKGIVEKKEENKETPNLEIWRPQRPIRTWRQLIWFKHVNDY